MIAKLGEAHADGRLAETKICCGVRNTSRFVKLVDNPQQFQINIDHTLDVVFLHGRCLPEAKLRQTKRAVYRLKDKQTTTYVYAKSYLATLNTIKTIDIYYQSAGLAIAARRDYVNGAGSSRDCLQDENVCSLRDASPVRAEAVAAANVRGSVADIRGTSGHDLPKLINCPPTATVTSTLFGRL
jgi:hypothetical protein